MVKNVLLVVVLLLALGSSCSKGPVVVVLYNNTPVDLTIHGDEEKLLADIAPGKTAEIRFQELQWIDFGMIGHRYDIKGFSTSGFVYGNKVKIQAENDGRLYLVPQDMAFPLKTFSQQPAGFPLVPVQKVDLT